MGTLAAIVINVILLVEKAPENPDEYCTQIVQYNYPQVVELVSQGHDYQCIYITVGPQKRGVKL